jgi:hypothetical protein
MLVFFGCKLGEMSSEAWVAAAVVAFLLSSILVQPLKVVIFASILSRVLKVVPFCL